MLSHRERSTCRVCNTLLPAENIVDLGEQAIVDFPPIGQEETRGYAPLQLVQCVKCELVQLRHTVNPEVLYRKFWYRSSINEQMRKALKDVTDSARQHVTLRAGDMVCDIGTNDGELLLNYSDNIKKVGFEPARELATEATRRVGPQSWIVNDFFKKGVLQPNSCKVITAIAMFYDLDNPLEFLEAVKEALHPDGVFVIQMNYLGTMLRNATFDNISHEHLCYYSLNTLQRLLERVGMRIIQVLSNDVNGGSIRVIISKDTLRPFNTLGWQLGDDRRMCSRDQMDLFAKRIDGICGRLRKFLADACHSGKKTYVYGASTRGATILQTIYRDFDKEAYVVLQGAAERDELKWGHYIAGTSIPIVREDDARKEADYFLLLPYHFWPSIRERERSWMMKGGKFIIPLPFPTGMEMQRIGGQYMPAAVDLDSVLSSVTLQ